MLKRITFLTLFLAMIFMLPKISEAQILKPTGTFTRQSSQMIYWYDAEESDPDVQITNTNDTEGVWIHVQMFQNDDPDGTPGTGDEIICDERDFVDFLTPNDTHVYDIDNAPFTRNTGETPGVPGGLVNIDIDDTTGFIIITPVVSDVDFTAISFQHLIGNITFNGNADWYNAMGRDALNFATGEVEPDGTPLDGVTNGFVVLQPDELIFNFINDGPVQVVGMAFQDSYGPAGLLGYNILPAEVTWTSFVFDYRENPTSCGSRTINCYDTLGIEEDDFDQVQDLLGDDDFLCGGIDIPVVPGVNPGADQYGWARIFVSGLGDFVSHLGIFANDYAANDVDDTVWMFTK